MCNGYWEKCNCEDCKGVKGMYEELNWLENDKEENSKKINLLTNKIESMGYSV